MILFKAENADVHEAQTNKYDSYKKSKKGVYRSIMSEDIFEIEYRVVSKGVHRCLHFFLKSDRINEYIYVTI